MLTALRVFEVMRQSGAGLDELTQEIQVYPQRLINVRIKERKRLEDLPAVAAEICAAEDSFGDSGRVLVRFSGTEPLARVMVEGPEWIAWRPLPTGLRRGFKPSWVATMLLQSPIKSSCLSY